MPKNTEGWGRPQRLCTQWATFQAINGCSLKTLHQVLPNTAVALTHQQRSFLIQETTRKMRVTVCCSSYTHVWIHTAQKKKTLRNCNYPSETRYNSHMFKGWRNYHLLPRKYRKHNIHKDKHEKYLFPLGENTFCCKSVAWDVFSFIGPCFL